MGRPPKRNLNYSTWDVNVLENDTSIDNLIDAQGPAGFYVYFALCQKAYATDGYFYRWGYDNAASTARKLGGGLKSTQVRAIVDLCVSLGLFDKALFTTDGILTSRAIQSRYLDGIARRTGEIPIIVEYWLLEVTPRAGLVFVHKNGETAYKNPDNEQQKPSFCTVLGVPHGVCTLDSLRKNFNAAVSRNLNVNGRIAVLEVQHHPTATASRAATAVRN